MAVPFLKLLLAGIDVGVLFLVAALLVSNCKSKRYRSRPWATAFHLLVMGWLILRGLFWVLAITTREEWHSNRFGLLYWLPNPLQFGSFLLLPMAYSKVLSSKKEWEAKSRAVGRVYVMLVCGMLVYMVGFALAQAIRERRQFPCVTADHGSEDAPRTCYTMELDSDAFRVLTSFCFFALAFGVAGYGLKMSKLTASQNREQLIYKPRALAALNCFLVAVFLSKGAYQIFSVMGLWYLPDIPLKGSEDVCVLNFCVFMFWDYLPTVWLLLVMEDTTGDRVGKSVVKAVFPSRASDFSDDLRHLPDYGLFREIKAAAAREAARSERAGSRVSLHRSYSSSLTPEQSPRVAENFASWQGPHTQGNAGSYANSFSSVDNLSQGGLGGGGGGGGGGSSNGYGHYTYGGGGGSAGTTARGASSIGSSLGGTAFITSPSEPEEEGGESQQAGGSLFGWFGRWGKRGPADKNAAEGPGGAAAGASGPSLWQLRTDAESYHDYTSGHARSTSVHGSGKGDGGGGGGGGDGDGDNAGGAADSIVSAVSRWLQGVLEGSRREESDRGRVDEASAMWKTPDMGAGGKSYTSFGELSRAEVTFSLRGYGGASERERGSAGWDWKSGGATDGQGPAWVGVAGQGNEYGGEFTTLARGDGRGREEGALDGAPAEDDPTTAWAVQQQQQQQQQQQHYYQAEDQRGVGKGIVGNHSLVEPSLGAVPGELRGGEQCREWEGAAADPHDLANNSNGVGGASGAPPSYRNPHLGEGGGGGGSGGDGVGGLDYHAPDHHRPDQTSHYAFRGDSTDLQERTGRGHRHGHRHDPGNGFPAESGGADRQEEWHGVAGMESRPPAAAGQQAGAAGFVEGRVSEGVFRPYHVPDPYDQHFELPPPQQQQQQQQQQQRRPHEHQNQQLQPQQPQWQQRQHQQTELHQSQWQHQYQHQQAFEPQPQLQQPWLQQQQQPQQPQQWHRTEQILQQTQPQRQRRQQRQQQAELAQQQTHEQQQQQQQWQQEQHTQHQQLRKQQLQQQQLQQQEEQQQQQQRRRRY